MCKGKLEALAHYRRMREIAKYTVVRALRMAGRNASRETIERLTTRYLELRCDDLRVMAEPYHEEDYL